MRYTTIIDLSDSALYRNHNVRLVYLHLVLKSGYHDQDRDLITVSIRNLAASVGLTVSATRHAVAQLEAAQLLRHEGSTWRVRKWIAADPPTARPKQPSKQKLDDKTNKMSQDYEQQVKEAREALFAAVREMTRAELEAWLVELEEGRSLKHHGAYCPANEQGRAWMRSVIDAKQ